MSRFDHTSLPGASEYNFFQLVRRLEAMLEEGNIHFTAQNTQSFSAGFIDEVGLSDDGADAQIRVNGFGLLGKDGPLPQIYSDIFYQANKDGHASPFAFINLFQNRLVQLLYLVKKRFDPMLFNSQASNSGLFDLLYSLSGLNTAPLDGRLPLSLEKLSGFGLLLANKRSDYSAIKQVIASLFDCKVDLDPMLGDWRALPQRFRASLQAGRNCLGTGIGLGRRYWDNNAALGVILTLPDKDACHAFLPGGIQHKALVALLSFLVDGKYKVHVTLKVEWRGISPASISVKTPLAGGRLGQTSWLKSAEQDEMPHSDGHFVIEPALYRRFWQEAV